MNETSSPGVAVVGAGYWGKNLIRNFARLGALRWVCDTNGAEAAGVLMMVGHIFVHHPAVKALRDLVASGELGTIRYVYSSRLNLGRVRQEENILFSFAPHDISIIEYILAAEPTAVSSAGGS